MRKVVILFISIMIFVKVWGQTPYPGTHFVVNYNAGVTSQGSQTWSIDMFNDEWVYFASREALLQYNGAEWSRFPLNNRRDLRSVHVSQEEKRIYVGGINEIGYFEPDDQPASITP